MLGAARAILPTAYLATHSPPTGLVLEVPDRVVVDVETERAVIRAVRDVLGDDDAED